MKILIAAPSASCPQWSVAIVNDNASRSTPPADWAVFGDGTTLSAARLAADVAANEHLPTDARPITSRSSPYTASDGGSEHPGGDCRRSWPGNCRGTKRHEGM